MVRKLLNFFFIYLFISFKNIYTFTVVINFIIIMNLKLFRKFQLLFSSITFFLTIYFFLNLTGLNIYSIQLSKFSYNFSYSFFWNWLLVVFGVILFFNSFCYITDKKINYKILISFLIYSSSVSLIFTGLLDISHQPYHDFFSFYYFICFPLGLFLLSHFNPGKLTVREWRLNLITSILLIFIPLISIPFFKGMAVAEILHSCIVFYWSFKTID